MSESSETSTLKLRTPSLKLLFAIVITNYIAQVPYYLHNYYFPHHLLPTPSSIILLGFTLLWFLVGYFCFIARKSYGFWLLLSFLVAEALFYIHTLLFGALVAQLHNPSMLIVAIFVIGYINGIAAGYYVVRLWRYKFRNTF